ncbi:hypothetical protein, partial [uncultured Parabacteroides sp.]|uniref:hypothetical protein n=1 Tax=uncultured Parabacteroides sp. TaxID=512312 RepID=UPI0026F02512
DLVCSIRLPDHTLESQQIGLIIRMKDLSVLFCRQLQQTAWKEAKHNWQTIPVNYFSSNHQTAD